MSRLKTSFFILAALTIIIIAAPIYALDISRQFPTLASHLVLTSTPLTVVFDQSLNPATVNGDSFFITLSGQSEHVPGQITISQTDRPNDTITFTPGSPWDWAIRHQLSVSQAVQSSGGDPFSGVLPDDGLFSANIPNDFEIAEYNPDDPMAIFIESSSLMGFNPLDPEADVHPWEKPGMNVTGAWKYQQGRPDVLVAVLDNGVKNYRHPESRRVFFLNRGELPLPNVGGGICDDYDCNLDGRFDVDDYEFDDRIGTDDPITVADLLTAFSNGKDEDNNGLTDDISGWDFFRNRNEVLGIEEFNQGAHGDGEVRLIAGEANNDHDVVPGVCPGCMVLSIRCNSGLLYDYALVAAGVRYAISMGADVINFAGGNLTWSKKHHQAFLDAVEEGIVSVAASGDEMTFHHWMPAAGEDVLSVKTLFPMVPIELMGLLNLGQFGFTETYCTNYGTHIHLSVPASTHCTSDSTGLTSGMLGLLYSQAKDMGLAFRGDEAKQLMTMTADDIADHCASLVNLLNLGDVCQEGFDEHFGYGRPDLERTIRAVGDRQLGLSPEIPPTVRITSPVWWQTIDPTRTPVLTVEGKIESRTNPYRWQLQLAPGNEPLEEEFITVASGTASRKLDDVIAEVPIDQYFPESWATGVPAHQYSFEVTIRLQAEYETAAAKVVIGESRKSISVHADNDPATGLIPGFPLDLGSSGESSPVLYDLDGDPDGRLEIVLGLSDGLVTALKYDSETNSYKALDGFPVDISGDDPWIDDSIFATIAVGDLFGDGAPEIVAATLGGNVWAISVDGVKSGEPILPGFPVRADEPDNSSSLAFGNGNSFFASPVLADLDRDGMLEIVAGSMDQKVYAWKPRGNSGMAERLSGWPVLIRSDQGLVPEEKICVGNEVANMIIGTPAVGILDPTNDDPEIGEHPAVVVSTTEACEGKVLSDTRVYALYHNGNDHPNGPHLPDWPAAPLGPLGDLLPIPMAVGSTASPAVVVTDQGAFIAPGSTAWFPQLIKYAENKAQTIELTSMTGVNFVSSAAFSSLDGSGWMNFIMPVQSVIRMDDDLGFSLFNAKVAAMNLAEPYDLVLEGPLEDHPMFAHPVVADLDGDGLREVVMGTGGYLAHAYSLTGTEAQGWPKYTQKWIMSSPAIGDLDADGLVEVVVHTREGFLYAWEAQGASCRPNGSLNSDWSCYHHDERNTGFYGTDTLPPGRVADLTAESLDQDRFLLNFTAPGDDWACGQAAAYDIRYSTDKNADLSDPQQFAVAQPIQTGALPAPAGLVESFNVEAPGAVHLAIQAVDDAGNLSRIGNDPFEEDAPADDDDDDQPADDGDDDDGCCGS